MNFTQDIILYGHSRFQVSRSHSFGQPGELPTYVAKSHCLVCPGCQTIWAALPLHNQPNALIWPVAQSCAECRVTTTWLPVPGSLLVEEGWGVIDLELLWSLPEPLLRREFDLHLRVYSNV